MFAVDLQESLIRFEMREIKIAKFFNNILFFCRNVAEIFIDRSVDYLI